MPFTEGYSTSLRRSRLAPRLSGYGAAPPEEMDAQFDEDPYAFGGDEEGTGEDPGGDYSLEGSPYRAGLRPGYEAGQPEDVTASPNYVAPRVREQDTPPPALQPPEPGPAMKRYDEVLARGTPPHPKHGLLRTIAETAAKAYLGPGLGGMIAHPKYTGQVEEYNRELSDTGRAAGMEQKTAEANRRATLDEVRAETGRKQQGLYGRQQEHIEWQESQPPRLAPPGNEGAYWTRKLDDPNPEVRATAQSKLDEIRRATHPNRTPPIRPPSTAQQRMAAVDDAVSSGAIAPEDGAARKKAITAETQGLIAPRREPRTPQATPGQFSQVSSDKAKRLAAIDNDTKELLEKNGLTRFVQDPKLQRTPEAQKAIDFIYSEEKKEKQQILDDYDERVVNLGGSISPKAAPRSTATPTPRPTPSTAPGTLNVQLKHPQTGEVKKFALTPQELQEANDKGFIQVQ